MSGPVAIRSGREKKELSKATLANNTSQSIAFENTNVSNGFVFSCSCHALLYPFSAFTENAKLQLDFVAKGVEGNGEGETEAEMNCRHGNPMFFPLSFSCVRNDALN